MKVRLTVSLALAALACAVALPAVAAEASGDCSVPISLGQKPKMNEYADYSDFLVAIMGYKKKERDQKEQRKACPELYIRPPVVWDLPESLDEALEQANNQKPFDYKDHPTWYNRSTSQSITLQDVPAGVLADEAVQASLGTLEFGPMADDQQASILLLNALNNSTENGSNGANLYFSFAEWLSPIREGEPDVAGLLLDNSLFSDFLVSADGGLFVALNGQGDIALVNSHYEFDNCLASCGQFPITIGFGP